MATTRGVLVPAFLLLGVAAAAQEERLARERWPEDRGAPLSPRRECRSAGPLLKEAGGSPREVDPDELYQRQLEMHAGRPQWDTPAALPAAGEDDLAAGEDAPPAPAREGDHPAIPVAVWIGFAWVAAGGVLGAILRKVHAKSP